jgi:L-alanine-DL-glutamate epimerase-like enolase superfamily enzyme
MVDARVGLIEQPSPVGKENLLDGFESPIPVAAHESVPGPRDVASLVGRFDAINIQLDKCGGLTAALEMAREARSHGLDVMTGNVIGTSLAMAPAWLVAQGCMVVDLDGPVFLRFDRENSVICANGCIACPEALWGHPAGNTDRDFGRARKSSASLLRD